ncbi:uncharacterized protein [Dysidea avara]|uniref:uncharacterized protein isoform X3 n=1 Tax=Dysidea avara TaxID=196820 RepID=UPI0033189163
MTADIKMFSTSLLSSMLVLVLFLGDTTSQPQDQVQRRSCPLGKFCRVGFNCNNVSGCVEICPSDTERMIQGNWSTGNCERIPIGTQYWMDSTLYEIFISPNVTGQFKDLWFIITQDFQRHHDNYDYLDDITFHLYPSDNPYFYFGNGHTTHVAFEDYYDLYLPDLIESCSLSSATSDPIPLDDYKLQVAVSIGGSELLRHDIIIHVVDPLSSLPPPVNTVEFEYSSLSVSESSGLLVVPLVLSGQTQSQSFSVIVIAEANSSLSPAATAGTDFIPGQYTATFLSGSTAATASIPIVADDIDEPTEEFSLRLYIDGAGYGMGLQKGFTVIAVVNILLGSPSITTHPTGGDVPMGGSVTLNCTASGIGTLVYSWERKSPDSSWTTVSNDNTTSYTTDTTLTSAVYVYRCRVNNEGGIVLSDIAIVNVYGPPTIITHPTSQLITVSMSITLNCEGTARGSITYQWQSRNINEGQWSNITSTQSSNNGSLVVNNLQESQQYRCVVFNEVGGTRSNVANVTILKIITHPLSTTVVALQDVTLTCSASFDLVTYSWYRVNGSVSVRSTGQNSNTLNIPMITANDDGIYYCMASKDGISVESNRARVMVEGLLVNFVSNNFTGSETSGSVPLEIAISSSGLANTSIVIEVSALEHSTMSATGSGVDFDSTSIMVTFNGENQKMVNVPITCDKLVEGTEMFNISLSIVSVSRDDVVVKLGHPSIATGVIIDSTVEMIFDPPVYTINENVGSLSPTIRLSQPSPEPFNLIVTLVDVNTTGDDYAQQAVTVPVTKNSPESLSFDITVNNDYIVEGTEVFNLVISPASWCGLASGNTAQVVIIDDEALTVQFNTTTFSGTEESGSVRVIVNLLGRTTGRSTVTVSVTTSPVTATAGIDYDATPLTATFNTGETSVTVTIPVVDDRVVNEVDEEFNLSLSISSATGVRVELGDVSSARGIIIDTTRPQITTHPLSKLIEVNNDSTNVQFTCMAEGASSYFWQRSDNVIPTGALGIKTNVLTLVRLVPPDAGQYRCVAVNQHGRNFTDYAILTIEAHDPVATITSSGERVNSGDQVTFTCSATGLGANSFKYGWLLNGVPVSRATGQTLVITASEDKSGDYWCTVRNEYGGFGRSSIARLTLNQFCNPVTVNYTGFNVTWNETLVGVTVEAPCTAPGLNGTIQRRCKGQSKWEEFNECFNIQVEELLEQVNNATMLIDDLNDGEKIGVVTNIATTLSNLTAPGQQTVHPKDISIVVNIISSLNNITGTVVDMLTPDDPYFEETTTIFDNLLNKNNQQSWQQLQRTSPDTSQSLVNGTEQFGRLLGETLNNERTEAVKTGQNIVIKAQLISSNSVQTGEDYVFTTTNDDLEKFTGRSAQFTFSNIVLRSILNQLPPNTTGFPITNTVLKDDILQLPDPNDYFLRNLPISPIMSIQAPVPINTTEDNPILLTLDVKSNSQVTDTLRNTETSIVQPHGTVESRYKSCRFYDHNLVNIQLNQAGGWSQEGLRLDRFNSTDKTVTCLTTHLTSFAVLVSVDYMYVDHGPEYALSIISYIGCAISLVCLVLSIILLTIVTLRKRDKINHPFIHLNLCIALALGLLVFVAGIDTATEYRPSAHCRG